MKIYDYKNIRELFAIGDISDRQDAVFSEISNNLASFATNKEMHPKEIERQNRLKTRRSKGSLTTMQHYQSAQYKNCALISAGSIGLGMKSFEHFEERFTKLNELFQKNNVHLFFIRGNNDDPSYFTDGKINYSNIKALEDYSVLEFNNFNCLCVGGGVSIDRQWKISQGKRLGKQLYWENEPTEYKKEELSNYLKDNDVSIVVTHDPPSFVGIPTSKYANTRWAETDVNVVNDVISQRLVIDSIYMDFIRANKTPFIWYYNQNGSQQLKLVLNSIAFASSNYKEGFLNFNTLSLSAFGSHIWDKVGLSKMRSSNNDTSSVIKNHIGGLGVLDDHEQEGIMYAPVQAEEDDYDEVDGGAEIAEQIQAEEDHGQRWAEMIGERINAIRDFEAWV